MLCSGHGCNENREVAAAPVTHVPTGLAAPGAAEAAGAHRGGAGVPRAALGTCHLVSHAPGDVPSQAKDRAAAKRGLVNLP